MILLFFIILTIFLFLFSCSCAALCCCCVLDCCFWLNLLPQVWFYSSLLFPFFFFSNCWICENCYFCWNVSFCKQETSTAVKEPVRAVYTEEDSTNRRNLPQGIWFGGEWDFWSYDSYFLGVLFVCLFVCFSFFFLIDI